ncbi:MAG TPA: ABC transporter substrate binding protein, partial [Anaerolineales bacterium]|nr:ABC transporter substrate binding protein [Anaerolineales bacterium]
MAALLLTACGGFGATPVKTYTIGAVNLTPALDPAWEGFKAGMAELGYVEGENVTYIYEGPVGSIDKLEPAAQSLLEADVDLMVALSTPAAQAAKRVTASTQTPVVFLPLVDPVGAGLVS